MDWILRYWEAMSPLLTALSCLWLLWRQRSSERALCALQQQFATRAVLMPAGPTGPVGPVGPAGPPGIMGPPGPPATCRCAEAEAAARDARTPQEKRAATLRLHKLIREGKMKAPEGWHPPRKRKKKPRGKKNKAG